MRDNPRVESRCLCKRTPRHGGGLLDSETRRLPDIWLLFRIRRQFRIDRGNHRYLGTYRQDVNARRDLQRRRETSRSRFVIGRGSQPREARRGLYVKRASAVAVVVGQRA